MILDSSCLFYFAWPRVSSGSDGIYLSPLFDMSPATSDCLEPYFSGGVFFSFPIIACFGFSGSFYFFLIFVVDPGSSVGTSKPSDTLGREFDPGKRDFSH